MQHALFMCVRIKQVWLGSGCGEILYENESESFCDVLVLVRWMDLDVKLVQCGCYLAWNLWEQHNSFIFEGKTTPLAIVIQIVFRHVEDFGLYSNRIYSGRRKQVVPSLIKWACLGRSRLMLTYPLARKDG